jgi:peptidyl-prolyl cis-trans isomerase D
VFLKPIKGTSMGIQSSALKQLNAKSFFIGGILLIVIVSFVVSGVGQMGGNLDVNTAAVVGNQTVTTRQLQESVSELDRSSGSTDPARRQANMQQALNGLIQSKIIVEEAHRAGWGASDLEVADWVKKIPAFQNQQTKKFDKELYDKFIKSGRMSDLELFAQGKDSIASKKYYNLLSLPDAEIPALAAEIKKRDGKEYFLEAWVLEPNAEQMKQKIAQEAQLFASKAENESALKSSYESNKTDYSRPQQTKILSILIAHKDANRAQGDALKRTKEEAKKIADSVYAQIQSGADFKKLASEQNDDPIAKSAQGDIGFVDETLIDTITVNAAKKLNKQQPMSEVLDTPSGFRLIKFIELREAVNKTFEQVKLTLAEKIVSQNQRQAFIGQMETEINAAVKEAQKPRLAGENVPEKLNALISKYGLTKKVLAKPVTVKTKFLDENIGMADPLLKHLMSVKTAGDFVSQVIDFSNKKAFFRVVKINESTEKKSSEDEEKMNVLLEKQEQMKMSQAFASAAQQKLYEMYNKDREIKRNSALLRVQ